MVDQSHPTALFLLEILLNHQGPIPIHALYLSFQASINNTNGYIDPYCLAIPINGASLTEFVEFLQSLPSLFAIVGNYVYPAGMFDVDHGSNVVPQTISFADARYINKLTSDHILESNSIPACFDPIIRRNTIAFLQNYLGGPNRYIPIQELHGCLLYISPVLRTSLPNLKSLTIFLRQYPEVFHLKDGMVRLTKQRRNCRYVFHTDSPVDNAASGDDGCCNAQDVPKFEVIISGSPDFANAKTTVLPASDFSVILILRRILRPAGDKGFHVAIVIKKLIEFSYDVQKIVGLTRFELHAFVEKYSNFFDVLPNLQIDSSVSSDDHMNEIKTSFKIPTSFCVRIKAQASSMRSRLVDYASCHYANGKNASRLEQHVGRVFRVAKSWGIIDLGNHVHVFFDKSIFRNVSDLQKVFQPNEIVHFDAIRAPHRSRAKWRATRVWKADDHDILRHVPLPQSSSMSNHRNGFNGTESCDFGVLASHNPASAPCLPFLAPPDRCKSKSSVESTPSIPTSTSATSATMGRRRCRSLDRLGSRTNVPLNNDCGIDLIQGDYSAYYLSDDDDLNLDLSSAKLQPDCSTDDYLPFLAFDALKRPIKLLHNTGGLLPDLEFPDSDISSWAPGEPDNVSVMNAVHPDKITCNASTQTWFTGIVTSAEFYHGPTCTHEQLVKE